MTQYREPTNPKELAEALHAFANCIADGTYTPVCIDIGPTNEFDNEWQMALTYIVPPLKVTAP